MKRRIFIPVTFLVIAFNAAAQHVQQTASGVLINKPGTDKITFHSLHEATNHIKFPATKGAVTGHSNGQLIYSGYIKKQKLHDRWMSYYNNNRLLDSGLLHYGIPYGEWKRWDTAGQLISIRNYCAEKLYQVKEEMRILHPKRYFYSLTDLYKTNKHKALYKLTAAYSFLFSAKEQVVQSLKEAVIHNSKMQNVYIPVFNECLHHGLYMNFFPGGVTRDSGYYKNGLRDAIWLQRNSKDGHFLIGAYKNGIRYKEWKQFDAAGRLYSIIYYNKYGEETYIKHIRR